MARRCVPARFAPIHRWPSTRVPAASTRPPTSPVPHPNDKGMKIDIFCHIFPQRFSEAFEKAAPGLKDMGKRSRSIPTMASLDARFRMMDEFGEYSQIISLGSPPIESYAGPDTSPRLAAIGNDGLAELVEKYPDRFRGFVAALPMNNPGEAEKELERSIDQLGAFGVQLYSNAAGKPLDAPEIQHL